jgi:hypothetical protein
VNEVVLFLDANVLAQPVTRTLLIAGSRVEGFVVAWSAHAEAEAERHLPSEALSIAGLRELLDLERARTSAPIDNLLTPSPGDRQILADAVEAEASFIITTDVDDYANEDLVNFDLSAVNPDYFMGIRFGIDAYRAGAEQLARGTRRPSRTPADVHQMLGRRHPRLTSRFSDLYDTTPLPADTDQPTALFRGLICVLCGEPLGVDDTRLAGIHASHG